MTEARDTAQAGVTEVIVRGGLELIRGPTIHAGALLRLIEARALGAKHNPDDPDGAALMRIYLHFSGWIAYLRRDAARRAQMIEVAQKTKNPAGAAYTPPGEISIEETGQIDGDDSNRMCERPQQISI